MGKGKMVFFFFFHQKKEKKRENGFGLYPYSYYRLLPLIKGVPVQGHPVYQNIQPTRDFVLEYWVQIFAIPVITWKICLHNYQREPSTSWPIERRKLVESITDSSTLTLALHLSSPYIAAACRRNFISPPFFSSLTLALIWK